MIAPDTMLPADSQAKTRLTKTAGPPAPTELDVASRRQVIGNARPIATHVGANKTLAAMNNCPIEPYSPIGTPATHRAARTPMN
jgi:hypothetical protein